MLLIYNKCRGQKFKFRFPCTLYPHKDVKIARLWVCELGLFLLLVGGVFTKKPADLTPGTSDVSLSHVWSQQKVTNVVKLLLNNGLHNELQKMEIVRLSKVKSYRSISRRFMDHDGWTDTVTSQIVISSALSQGYDYLSLHKSAYQAASQCLCSATAQCIHI